MCGIFCFLENINKSPLLQQLCEECERQIQKRGPNSYNKLTHVEINNHKLHLSASVLWLQGETITEQPLVSPNSLFAYNGDVFGGSAFSLIDRIKYGDTTMFLDSLETSSNVIQTLSNIEGPYAFIWFNKTTSCLYFGRDHYGRRSLLIGVDNDDKESFIITSVATRSNVPFIELPAIGIFCLNLLSKEWKLFTWPETHKNFDEKVASFNNLLNTDITVVYYKDLVSRHENNTFIAPSVNDLNLFEKIKSLDQDKLFEAVLNDEMWFTHVKMLKLKLETAVKVRISTQSKYCLNCLPTKSNCHHCRVGILFSGGVDCTLLAVIIDEFLDNNIPIDLLNVAFDKSDYNTPDRLTGLECLEELKRLRPGRVWNFVPINVTNQELNDLRRDRIANLIFPLNTILDDSLGCALWFASRGKIDNYESPCRLLIVGMGADELFGGYTRHRAVFKNKGWEGLHYSLEEDWANIAHRNLARDDRVVSDHGRQLRTPYLDEEVVEYVQRLKVWQKSFPSSDVAQGLGEKILLRTLAYYLGLRTTAGFKKRALQFGSRIADKNEKAHEISSRLLL